jgi:hypothetical protein
LHLQMDQVLRVVAVDSGSLVKALAVLRTATYRLQRNHGHMLVVQPTLIGRKAADGEDVPVGSTLFYTQAIRAGEWCRSHCSSGVRPCTARVCTPASCLETYIAVQRSHHVRAP